MPREVQVKRLIVLSDDAWVYRLRGTFESAETVSG
jgi:hypothetical protein